MNISEAIKKAEGKKITRKSWIILASETIWIEPTDTPDCCILYFGEKRMSKRWNPEKEDLIADDWIISR